jgi:peptide/nickel transport system substrate-binding protein
MSSRRHRRLLGGLVAVLFVLGACGGDDDDDDAAPPGTDGSESPAEEPEEDVEPVRGGTLTYAVEADTASPWTPQAMVCAAACYSTVGRTVYEPLTLVGDDGQVYPYLLESLTPNEDFTEWTLVVRDDITFHDGTPLDGPAVAYNLNSTQNAALVGLAVGPMETVTDDGDMTVTVAMNTSWPAFGNYISSQLGLMASPQWLEAVAAGTADETEPVGTGPFVFESYESGENGRFTAVRNENYWRGDGPDSTGEGLPYLDRVEVRFMPDSQARTEALLSGEIDYVQTNNGVEIGDLRETDGINVETMEHQGEIEVGYLLINNSPEVSGAPNPMADVRVRRAIAHATDNEVLSETRTGGLFPVANGPFPPGRVGHLDDTGFPAFDPEAAEALVEEYESENGPLQISLKTTTDPFNLTTSELLKEMWEAVGVEVGIDQIPQGEFINQALAGNFQIFTWRNHAGVDPDSQFVWWSSTTTSGIALNFGRIDDPQVDALLDEIRTNTDPDARREAAEELNRYFGEQVFNVWNTWTFWGHATREGVHNTGVLHIPGAPEGVTALIGGVVTPIEMFETS